MFEALRFRPSMPALERVCTREAQLGGRTMHRDEKLLLDLTAAMLDDRGIQQADEFRAGRPHEDYLHFGRTTHRCLGEAVARIQMKEIAAALLRRPNARKIRKMEADGPFPRHLVVGFDRIPG